MSLAHETVAANGPGFHVARERAGLVMREIEAFTIER